MEEVLLKNKQEIIETIKLPTGKDHGRIYTKGKLLGQGAFATCYQVTNTETQQVHACKVILKAGLTRIAAKQKLMTELTIHRQIKHFNICQFQHFFEDSEHVYMLLEFCPNKSLGEVIERRGRLHELEV